MGKTLEERKQAGNTDSVVPAVRKRGDSQGAAKAAEARSTDSVILAVQRQEPHFAELNKNS